MKVAFVSEWFGLTGPQLMSVARLLGQRHVPGAVLAHTDAPGDVAVHAVALAAGYRIHLYPSRVRKLRQWCQGAELEYPPEVSVKRYRGLVEACDCLLAAPGHGSSNSEHNGGTFRAISDARKQGKPVTVVYVTGRSYDWDGEPGQARSSVHQRRAGKVLNDILFEHAASPDGLRTAKVPRDRYPLHSICSQTARLVRLGQLVRVGKGHYVLPPGAAPLALPPSRGAW